MFPVLYEGKTDEDIPRFKSGNKEYEIDFDHLHIYDWRELIEILKRECESFSVNLIFKYN